MLGFRVDWLALGIGLGLGLGFKVFMVDCLGVRV